MEIIRHKLENDKTLRLRTRLTADDLMELVEFILTTTYFTCQGSIYQQKKGVAMGSPLSPVAVNMFMEWLEEEAIKTAPAECKPRMWKRYVDDILEIVDRGQIHNLTNHLNQVDPTENIKFTFEEESDGEIAFLDTKLIRKTDGSIKLDIYRKPTHTNQYLQFSSHHPLHQKLGVIRTLYDRKDSIVTEEADKTKEEGIIKQALTTCGYPPWALDRVTHAREISKQNATSKKPSSANQDNNKGLVVIPYAEGVSERVSRVFKKHGFSTALKPHRTLRSMVVHPKDKRNPEQSADMVYEIPCNSCAKTYVGETARIFKTRLGEHKKEAMKFDKKKYTRSRASSTSDHIFKSAVAEHSVLENHVIGWSKAKQLDQEANKTTRWLKESIWIRSRGDNTMNKDDGGYKLNRIFDQLITKRQPESTRDDVTRQAVNQLVK